MNNVPAVTSHTVELAGGITLHIECIAAGGDNSLDCEVRLAFDADLVPVHVELLSFGKYGAPPYDQHVLMLASCPAFRNNFPTEDDYKHHSARRPPDVEKQIREASQRRPPYIGAENPDIHEVYDSASTVVVVQKEIP